MMTEIKTIDGVQKDAFLRRANKKNCTSFKVLNLMFNSVSLLQIWNVSFALTIVIHNLKIEKADFYFYTSSPKDSSSFFNSN